MREGEENKTEHEELKKKTKWEELHRPSHCRTVALPCSLSDAFAGNDDNESGRRKREKKKKKRTAVPLPGSGNDASGCFEGQMHL